MTIDSYRDAYGIALAYLDGDMERVADLIDAYSLGLPECHLLLSVLAILTVGDDEEALRDRLAMTALMGAGRSSE